VKLVDFGLAKANSQIESTDPGVVKGKFSYLSPEAASGLEVDARADVFAVGIILWELFTGKRLFYGDTDYATVEQVRQARVPSLQALNPDIEPELEGVVRKALARDPEDRYHHAADLGDALAQYLFSRRMKVTARDIAQLVRDTQLEMMRKRSAEPKASLIDALINDEVNRLTSLVGDEAEPQAPGGGSQSLDPSHFVDTSSWTNDLLDSQSTDGRRATAAPVGNRAPAPAPRPSDDGLSSMLEPDRTGVHERRGGRGLVIGIVVALVVAAVAAAVIATQVL
jgi:serine/threonine-protein kinase